MSHFGVLTHTIQETSHAVGQGLQQSHEAMQSQLMQQRQALGRLEKLMENLQQDEPRPPKNLARRAASKPAAFKEICDGVYELEQKYISSPTLDESAHSSQNRDAVAFQSLRSTPIRNRLCICTHPYRLMAKEGLWRGHGYLLASEWESQGHWPSCPLSKTVKKSRRAISLEYAGLARVVKLIIKVTFAWTSGAGGSSISPNFTYVPTVDQKSSPAFRILNLMLQYYWIENRRPSGLLLAAGAKRLARLLYEKRVHPAAVAENNQNLMHRAVFSVGFWISRTHW